MIKLISNCNLWIVLLALLVLPFLLLSFFAHPSADDFIFSASVRDNGVLKMLYHVYFLWSGRYFATLINCFNPLVYGWMWGYKLIPFLLIIFFYSGILSFINSVFPKTFPVITKHLFSLILLLLYFNIIPSTAECIYWMNGSLSYFLAGILTLFFFASLIREWFNEKKGIYTVMQFILFPVLIAGLNEVNMLFLEGMLLLLFIAAIFKKRHIKRVLWISVLSSTIACIVVLSTPGNYAKMELFPLHGNLFYSILQSMFSFVKIAGCFLQDPSFLLVSVIFLIYLPIFLRSQGFKMLVSHSPFITVPLSIVLLMFLYFPVVYSTGLHPALRVHNAVGLLFIFAWFYNIAVTRHYLMEKSGSHYQIVDRDVIIMLAVASFILVITAFHKEPGVKIIAGGNIFRAGYDLYENATTYNCQMEERYTLIEESVKHHRNFVEVNALTKIPATIHFVDITYNTAYWVNQATAKYFKLDSIRLKK